MDNYNFFEAAKKILKEDGVEILEKCKMESELAEKKYYEISYKGKKCSCKPGYAKLLCNDKCKRRQLRIVCDDHTCLNNEFSDFKNLDDEWRLVYLKPTQRCGLGLYANKTIAAKKIIGEYTGVIRTKEEIRKLSRTEPKYWEYAMEIAGKEKNEKKEKELCIDAYKSGSFMRYANFTCDESQRNAYFEEMQFPNGPRVFLIATKKIEAYQQIYVGYGPLFRRNNVACCCGNKKTCGWRRDRLENNKKNMRVKALELKGVYPCDICNRIISTEAKLRLHKLRHEGIKDYVCRIKVNLVECKETFTTNWQLKRHEKFFHRTQNTICGLCSSKFILDRLPPNKKKLARVRARKGVSDIRRHRATTMHKKNAEKVRRVREAEPERRGLPNVDDERQEEDWNEEIIQGA